MRLYNSPPISFLLLFHVRHCVPRPSTYTGHAPLGTQSVVLFAPQKCQDCALKENRKQLSLRRRGTILTFAHLLEPFISHRLVPDRSPDCSLHTTGNAFNGAFDVAGKFAGGAGGVVGTWVGRGYDITRGVGGSDSGGRHGWLGFPLK